MPQPLNEILIGTVDGANLVFYFSVPYTAGTAVVLLNGQVLLHNSGNPWTESNPLTGEVTLDAVVTPQLLDQVSGIALDTTPVGIETILEAIDVTIDDVPGVIAGAITSPDALYGSLADYTLLTAAVVDYGSVLGSLVDRDALIGSLEDC
jgi:hypothetical protein